MLTWSISAVLKSRSSWAAAAVPLAASSARPRTSSRRESDPFSKRVKRLEMIDSMSASPFGTLGCRQETIRHDPIVAVWGFSVTAMAWQDPLREQGGHIHIVCECREGSRRRSGPSAAHHGDVTGTALLRRDRVSLLAAAQTTGGHFGGARGSLNNVWLVWRDNGCVIVVAVPRVRDQYCSGRAPMPEMPKGRHSGSVHGTGARKGVAPTGGRNRLAHQCARCENAQDADRNSNPHGTFTSVATAARLVRRLTPRCFKPPLWLRLSYQRGATIQVPGKRRSPSHAQRTHSGLMPFASMNLVQFLISVSSLVLNAEPGAKSGVMSNWASRSRTPWLDMTAARAFSSCAFTPSGRPFGPKTPNQKRSSTSTVDFTPASCMVGTVGIAGDRAALVTASALILPASTRLFVPCTDVIVIGT